MNSIHLVLISAQAVPNITPILDERFRPDRVIMLVSRDMEARAASLEQIYRPRGVKVGRWPIDDAWDVEHIRNRVVELLSEFEQEDITLNATGGTKPMSIAAYEVFRAFDKPIFYVHPERDRLIWMHPGDRDSVDLADRIKLKEYLQAYGADEVNETYKFGVPPSLRDLTSELIEHIGAYAPALGSLNYFAAFARNAQLRSPEVDADFNGNHAFWELLDLFQQAGLLRRDGKCLVFADDNARFIANGGWLELYAYACCLNVKKSLALQDVGHSIEVSRRHGKNSVLNEMDVAFLKDNRLYLLECKTKRLKGGDRRHDEGAEVLYKLDSLRDLLGGLQAKAMLVSFNPLKPHNRNRARELNIEYCCHQDLKFLEQKIAQWLENGR
ncbi:Card1-like endonuclease domain-containing protein [Methylomarinum vadi]|uniref:Card1-like endonuclease domain-containing protein n=1 Tax=Methylomarinum vadi TaxID=438855 RepID=UPI0004DF867F|nr:DUF1887 family CARF protein [Methylomarinum vadi]